MNEIMNMLIVIVVKI